MPYFQVQQHGPITEIVMSPTLAGRQLFPFRAYMVDGLLIDTGPPVVREQMAAFLREHRIEQVVNTHHHEDHAGNNALINERLGLTPLAHPLAVPILADLPPIQLYRKLIWRTSENSRVAAVGATVTTPRYTFDVIHTPGHAEDHVVLHERNEGWLFTGDLYIADRLKLLRREEDPHVMASSIARTLESDFDRVFCAHRGPVADGHAAMRRKLDSMAEFGARVRELHAAGLGAREILARLHGREDRLMATFSAGDFTRLNLVEAYLPGWPGPEPFPSRR